MPTNTGNIWTGADPGLNPNSSPLEIGSVVQALRPVTLTGIRILGNPSAPARAGRRARLWNTINRTLITSIALPDSLPSGWYVAPISYPMATADTVMVSYDTDGAFPRVINAFITEKVAPDGAMRFPAGLGTGGFGGPAVYPSGIENPYPFYGVDVTYSWEGELPPPPPPTPGTMAANSALVAAAWLNSVPSLDAPAATSRPSDVSSWSATGFLVTSVVGSAGARDLSQQRKPIVSVDVWAVSPGASKPPRAKAAAIAEQVRAAVESAPRTVVPVAGSVGYASALITDVWLETAEPREIPDPDSSYAHFTMDLGLSWVRAG